MTLLILGHSFHYEMENLTRMFFPGEPVDVRRAGDPAAPDTVATRLERKPDGTAGLLVRLTRNGLTRERSHFLDPGATDHDAELAMGRELYRLLSEETGIEPPWGILTGIRPVRLLRDYEKRFGDKAAETLQNRCLVSDGKLALAKQILEIQRPVLQDVRTKDFSLYVSIPFCPSRCSYCSFVSHDIDGVRKLLPDYLDRLGREIVHSGRIASRLGLRLRTVYIGGGTPTVLAPMELETLMETIRRSFDLTSLLEYTVEAGRPDSITREKLAVLASMGADRVSINPQTMDDSVLERIGRKHTAAESIAAYALAREAGFRSINMDLIAGLPGDSPDGFRRTAERVEALRPENITVHTLTVKRSSRLKLEEGQLETRAEPMVDFAGEYLTARGYLPYYLYRQKATVENLENTGYALPGKEGLYNILIMEEAETILAVGAGAVTKLVGADGNIKRILNYKFPYEYIARFEEMLARKDAIEEDGF